MKKSILLTSIRIALSFVALITIFLSGSFNKKTSLERVAEYSSQVVKNNTRDKNYCAISFDAPNKAGTYYSDEFETLFDVFKSGIVSYASAMNANKKRNIKLKDFDDSNLSLVFTGPVGSMEIVEEETKTIRYRHYKYNFDTMFSDPTYNGTEFDKKHAPIAYISQSQADKLLNSKNIIKENGSSYSKNQYESLIKTGIILNIDGDDCTYYVWNVFYNRGFYYQGLRDVLGEYILTSYYHPKEHDLRMDHKSLYFFNEYSYFNQYLMNYLNQRYENENIIPSVVSNNITKDFDTNYLLSFFKNEKVGSNQWIFTLFLMLSICLIGFSISIIFLNKKDNIYGFLITIFSLFVPYLIFKLIYLVTKDVLFFSQPSCKWNLILVTTYLFVYLTAFLFKNKKHKYDDFYEKTI